MIEVDVLVMSIEPGRCQGHNRCFAIAPQLVDVDEWGQACVRGDGIVPTELHEKAALVVANCPEFAIKLSKVTTKKPE